jgi:hypothetical protein
MPSSFTDLGIELMATGKTLGHGEIRLIQI